MAELKGNPYADESFMNSAKATLALTHEARTANLIAVHNNPNLRAYLDDAEGIELEKLILRRLGLKDA